VFELLMQTCFASFQAYERLEFIPIALISQRTLIAGVGIAALLAGADVVVVAAVYLAGTCFGFLLALTLLRTRLVRPALRIEPRRWWPLMKAASAIGLAGVFAVVLFRVDMTMLAAFKGATIVGHYAAAYRLLEATLFISWSVSSAVYPVFSRLTPATDPPVGFVFERGIKLGLALTLPLATGVLVLAEPVIDLLYGDAYSESVGALRLLAPAIALYPVCYITASFLVSQNRQRALLVVYAFVAVENIAANFVLIPWLSLYGAALGTSVSTVLVAGGFLAFAGQRLDYARILGGPVLASAIAACVMVLLRESFPAAVVSAAVVYVGVLVLFERRLFPDDARAVLDFLPGRTA
jgi:O-antigen/teichoic acid export membrane protein